MKMDGKTKVYAVIGYPVEHSISPVIHNTLFEYYQMNCIYVPFSVRPDCFKSGFLGMRDLGMGGFNVTIPHKKAALELLDFVEDYAKIVGAVNTVAIRDNQTYGYNTDGVGLIRALEEEGESVSGKKIVILGGGGVVNSIGVKFAMEGANSIVILTRRPEQGEAVCERINAQRKVARYAPFSSAAQELKNCDILVNATPVGMYPHTEDCPIPSLEGISEHCMVCDLIYNPYETKLMSLAKQAGCRRMNGLAMLIYQGFAAFTIWTGIVPDEEVTKRVKQRTCEVLGIG